jgi:hypothetical protein
MLGPAELELVTDPYELALLLPDYPDIPQRKARPKEARRYWEAVKLMVPLEYDWLWPFFRHYDGHAVLSGSEDSDLGWALHRQLLTLTVGPPPDPDLIACHVCNQPACLSKYHCYWGTDLDNMTDRKEAGNYFYTPRKLDLRTATRIRALHEGGSSHQELIDRFGIKRRQLRNVVNGYSWVKPPEEGWLTI